MIGATFFYNTIKNNRNNNNENKKEIEHASFGDAQIKIFETLITIFAFYLAFSCNKKVTPWTFFLASCCSPFYIAYMLAGKCKSK